MQGQRPSPRRHDLPHCGSPPSPTRSLALQACCCAALTHSLTGCTALHCTAPHSLSPLTHILLRPRIMLRVLSRAKALRSVARSAAAPSRFFSALPEHILVPMPALSPVSAEWRTGTHTNCVCLSHTALRVRIRVCRLWRLVLFPAGCSRKGTLLRRARPSARWRRTKPP